MNKKGSSNNIASSSQKCDDENDLELNILDESDETDIQPTKRVRTDASCRPVRNKRPIERLGLTEELTNDDHLFLLAGQQQLEQIVPAEETVKITVPEIVQNVPVTCTGETLAKSQTDETVHQANIKNTDSTILAVMSPGEKVIFKTLLDMAAEIKVLKSHIFTGTVHGTVRPNKIIEKNKLLEIGLPFKEKGALGKFEYDLLQDEFKEKVVGTHLNRHLKKVEMLILKYFYSYYNSYLLLFIFMNYCFSY